VHIVNLRYVPAVLVMHSTNLTLIQDFLSIPENSVSANVLIPQLAETIPQREPLRHLLIGSSKAVRHTIHELHILNYAEAIVWSPLMLTGNANEVMSILIRYLLLQ